MPVRSLEETPYDLRPVPSRRVATNMSPQSEVTFFFLDSSRTKGDNMAKLVVMGDLPGDSKRDASRLGPLIDQGAFYAGR